MVCDIMVMVLVWGVSVELFGWVVSSFEISICLKCDVVSGEFRMLVLCLSLLCVR